MRHGGSDGTPLTYNDFDGELVARFLRERMGKEIIGLNFGREYSPVLYLRLRSQGDAESEYAVDEKKIAEIIKSLKRLGADELWVEKRQLKVCHDGKYENAQNGSHGRVIRAWWD